MAATDETALRLLAAIEEFSVQVALALGAGDCLHALAIQRRGAPLVTRLCELGNARGRGWGPAAQRRLETILALRSGCQARMATMRKQFFLDRARLAEGRRRLQALAPAYRNPATTGYRNSRLNAAV